ncbi:dihydrolipoyl dehydrogenase [Pelotomaculum terephthalicicum JT]|uniref:dihydrolipoyl dehydrogenase n=1 Tax=Pelotomaculum TaxID=191373 RepID=UPI0009C9818C|nr:MULTISPECIES: dihydrolipoyl dehydrogenase [Pelotomaculum]MCG9966720.1 dihydrolipoyl dehydrogenase [Pelotomaculum terephthalicicum JT]OPX91422.1 MAG: Dihydrolipoyl dehydrogenase [Pelotomaculum sp. PtaB.Bin117]OPY62958.1 MAG: Dihydrolipoyl dehydrogenase [Pelotomaculum sp. PtaU1.Bin065]
MSYNIVIIGAGPGGYVAAIRAARLGAKVAVVEKDEVGGTCLNRGCIPTKTLACGAELLNNIRRAAEFGIATGEVMVDFSRLMERKNKVVAQLVAGVNYLIKKNKIDLIRGTARLQAPGKVRVAAAGGGEIILTAENIVIATGTEPALITALGYDGELVLTSNEALNVAAIPEKMLVIGGGVIGCEFACIFNTLGSKVTVLEVMPAILPALDREAAKTMQGLLKRQGITVKTKAHILEVKKSAGTVAAVLESGEEIAADRALISIGRTMNSGGLGLEEAGVAVGGRGEVIVNDKLETSVPGIYAIGDITGKIQLAHVASAQGVVAVDNILGRPREMDYRVIPNCIFTHPEVAGVGLTTQEAQEKGINVKSGKFSFIASGKAQAMGETSGFVKILADPDNDRVLGVHIVGPRATDLIAEAALAVKMGITVQQLTETVHAHPTLSEAVLEAAEAVHGMSIHT